MIGKSRWYAAPDDTIDTWAFLLLKTVEEDGCEHVVGWKLGLGNPVQLTDTTSREATTVDEEQQILEQLIEELAPHRYEGVLLVVPRNRTIHLLRTRLLALEDNEQATLRGFSALALRAALNRYFVTASTPTITDYPLERPGSGQDAGSFEYSSETLRRALNRIGPLLPRSSLAGAPL